MKEKVKAFWENNKKWALPAAIGLPVLIIALVVMRKKKKK